MPTRKAGPGSPPSLDGLDDPSGPIRFGYGAIILGFGVFGLWAVLAPIGEGIPAPGVVVVESHRKTVTHLIGGTVATLRVRENMSVKEGDILLELDARRTQTARDTAAHEYIAAAARLARFRAEQTGADRIEIPEDVRGEAQALGRQDLLTAQEQLFRARREALRSELAVLQESLTASRIQVNGLRQQLAARQMQADLLRQELENTRPLAAEGITPRNRLLEQERQLAELTSVTSDLEARAAREGSSSAEIRLRILQRRQDFLKEVETQATETRREVANAAERLKDADIDLARMTLRAPVSGQVVSLAAAAPGVVITPNAKIMEIVPAGERLLIDAKVPVTAASRVRPDLDTDIRVSVFPENPMLVIGGKVISVSTDRHEPPNEPPYYLARVAVTPEGIERLEGRVLRPGMTTDVVIKTGERSFLTYLMEPIARRVFPALREP